MPWVSVSVCVCVFQKERENVCDALSVLPQPCLSALLPLHRGHRATGTITKQWVVENFPGLLCVGIPPSVVLLFLSTSSSSSFSLRPWPTDTGVSVMSPSPAPSTEAALGNGVMKFKQEQAEEKEGRQKKTKYNEYKWPFPSAVTLLCSYIFPLSKNDVKT